MSNRHITDEQLKELKSLVAMTRNFVILTPKERARMEELYRKVSGGIE